MVHTDKYKWKKRLIYSKINKGDSFINEREEI